MVTITDLTYNSVYWVKLSGSPIDSFAKHYITTPPCKHASHDGTICLEHVLTENMTGMYNYE